MSLPMPSHHEPLTTRSPSPRRLLAGAVAAGLVALAGVGGYVALRGSGGGGVPIATVGPLGNSEFPGTSTVCMVPPVEGRPVTFMIAEVSPPAATPVVIDGISLADPRGGIAMTGSLLVPQRHYGVGYLGHFPLTLSEVKHSGLPPKYWRARRVAVGATLTGSAPGTSLDVLIGLRADTPHGSFSNAVIRYHTDHGRYILNTEVGGVLARHCPH